MAIGGCGAQAAGECQLDTDCASGSCGENGQCNTTATPDASPEADAGAADARVSACGGEVDDEIVRGELPMQAGIKADFRVATGVTFDTTGDIVDGTRRWNLDQSFAGDVDVETELFSTQDAWYQDLFPTASYSATLSQESDLLGVFRLADDGLYLLGVVSPADGASRTELTYDPPALLMPLPLSEGASWTTDAAVTGLASGFLSSYSELYQGQADASGTLETPFGSFRVIRNRTTLTRTIGFSSTVSAQYSFVSECAGIVGGIVSTQGEEDDEFSEVAELRRLIP